MMVIVHVFTSLSLSLSLDQAYQQNIPHLDGGEGCSEYIIHGTNVDLSSPVDDSTTTAEHVVT